LVSEEENMLKPVITATAVLAIAGSSIVYAQQSWDGRGGDGGPRFEHRHHHLSAEDRAAFTDARIAALKAGLELTADQAKNWPAFEQALRDLAQLRIQRIQAREAAANQPPQTPTSPFDRMSRRADNMAKTSAALKHVADAGAPLYMSLTDAQKERFKMLAHMLRPHHRMHAWREGGGWREGMGREGMGREGMGREGMGRTVSVTSAATAAGAANPGSTVSAAVGAKVRALATRAPATGRTAAEFTS
jgi:LTXXQ motif family protein